MKGAAMDLGNLFFSLEGRINRAKFWIGLIILFVLQWIVMIAAGTVLGVNLMMADPTQPMPASAGVAMLVILLLFLWPSICVYAKRWHDRDKSGWWTLIVLVPVAGAIWILVECGCLRGTRGDNRFGPDPLAG